MPEGRPPKRETQEEMQELAARAAIALQIPITKGTIEYAKANIPVPYVALSAIIEYSLNHKQDIENDINDYGDLKAFIEWVEGIPNGRQI